MCVYMYTYMCIHTYIHIYTRTRTYFIFVKAANVAPVNYCSIFTQFSVFITEKYHTVFFFISIRLLPNLVNYLYYL